jgi:hypothetical protein
MITCPKCAGTGDHPDASKPGETCPRCEGAKMLTCTTRGCPCVATAEVIVGEQPGDHFNPPEPRFGPCRNARPATALEIKIHRAIDRLCAPSRSW